jgi:hypothetical protein
MFLFISFNMSHTTKFVTITAAPFTITSQHNAEAMASSTADGGKMMLNTFCFLLTVLLCSIPICPVSQLKVLVTSKGYHCRIFCEQNGYTNGGKHKAVQVEGEV